MQSSAAARATRTSLTAIDRALARRDFCDNALAAATTAIEAALAADMNAAGASAYEVSRAFDERTVDLSGSPMFVEGILTLTGSGRPDLDS